MIEHLMSDRFNISQVINFVLFHQLIKSLDDHFKNQILVLKKFL